MCATGVEGRYAVGGSIPYIIGDSFVDLFISSLDRLCNVTVMAAEDGNVDVGEDGFDLISEQNARVQLPAMMGLTDINSLDGSLRRFSEAERFIISYLDESPTVQSESQRDLRSFIASALVKLIQSSIESRGGKKRWMPDATWIREVVLLIYNKLRDSRFDVARLGLKSLRPEEIAGAEKIVIELKGRLEEPLVVEPAWDRRHLSETTSLVDLSANFDPQGFRWDKDAIGTHDLMTFGQYMDQALYGPYGYYTTHADIGNGGDFYTAPQALFPIFGGAIGEIAHDTFNQLIEDGKLGDDEPFVIREDGGGRGELARGALLYLQTMALLNPGSSYDHLWERLMYIGVEISPELGGEQERKVDEWVQMGMMEPGKFVWQGGDATQTVIPGIEGLAVSNELPDAFPVHKFYVTDTGGVYAVVPIPYLYVDIEEREGFIVSIWGDEAAKVEEEAGAFGQRYNLTNSDGRIYLPAKRFVEYTRWLHEREVAGEEHPAWYLLFIEGVVDVTLIPELASEMKKREVSLFAGLVERGEGVSEAYLDLETARYFDSLARSFEAGAAIIIDYMSLDFRKPSYLRMYSGGRRTYRDSSPYLDFGHTDITRSPDARQLSEEFERAGFRMEYFGHQSKLPFLAEILGDKSDERVRLGQFLAYFRLLAYENLVDDEEKRIFDQWLVDVYQVRTAGPYRAQFDLEDLVREAPDVVREILIRDVMPMMTRQFVRVLRMSYGEVCWRLTSIGVCGISEVRDQSFHLMYGTK